MPFTKSVLPVLPKPDHLVGSCQTRPLSAIEDKELRKKLRNRQSALAARERKKARMLELERNVAELQQANKALEEENSKLRHTLNAILRSASAPTVCGIFSNVNNGQRTILTKTPVKSVATIESQVCGTLQTPEPNRNTNRQNVEYVTVQANCRPKVCTITQPCEENIVEISKQMTSNTESFGNQDMTPIDYSIHANKVQSKSKYSTSVESKPIKIEGQEENVAISALGKRQHEILRSLSTGTFANQKLIAVPQNAIVNIKKEVSDVFEYQNEGEHVQYNWQSPQQQSETIPDQYKNESNSLFAQALKRSAHAMLLSTKQYTPVYANSSSSPLNNNTNNNNITTTNYQCKRKQALPSIDAVFNTPSKVSRLSYADEQVADFNSRISEQTVEVSFNQKVPRSTTPGISICRTTVPQLTLNTQDDQPLSLVKWSTSTNKCKRDPYLHQSNETQLSTFGQSLSKQMSNLTEEQLGMIPNDLSAIIDNYSNVSPVDGDDMLVGLYDSSAGNSPLESVSSRDSGLGVEDDPLDWIPDTSFFDFQ